VAKLDRNTLRPLDASVLEQMCILVVEPTHIQIGAGSDQTISLIL
jgi:hypothetical protein